MMMNSMNCKWVWIATFVVVAAVSNTQVASEVSCIGALTSLLPCQPFLIGTSASVIVPCCDAVASLSQQVGSDRAAIKSLCTCFKQAAPVMGVNPDRARQLPDVCQVAVPVPIDPNVDCDSL